MVTWAGARGVVPLAAALSIPLPTESGQPLEGRSLILVLAIAVIVISLVVRASHSARLCRGAGVSISRDATQQQLAAAWDHLVEAGLAHLDQVADASEVNPDLVEHARRAVQATADMATSSEPDSAADIYRQTRRDVLARQVDELHAMAARGQTSDPIRRKVQHQLDLEVERLRGHAR